MLSRAPAGGLLHMDQLRTNDGVLHSRVGAKIEEPASASLTAAEVWPLTDPHALEKQRVTSKDEAGGGGLSAGPGCISSATASQVDGGASASAVVPPRTIEEAVSAPTADSSELQPPPLANLQTAVAKCANAAGFSKADSSDLQPPPLANLQTAVAKVAPKAPFSKAAAIASVNFEVIDNLIPPPGSLRNARNRAVRKEAAPVSIAPVVMQVLSGPRYPWTVPNSVDVEPSRTSGGARQVDSNVPAPTAAVRSLSTEPPTGTASASTSPATAATTTRPIQPEPHFDPVSAAVAAATASVNFNVIDNIIPAPGSLRGACNRGLHKEAAQVPVAPVVMQVASGQRYPWTLPNSGDLEAARDGATRPVDSNAPAPAAAARSLSSEPPTGATSAMSQRLWRRRRGLYHRRNQDLTLYRQPWRWRHLQWHPAWYRRHTSTIRDASRQ